MYLHCTNDKKYNFIFNNERPFKMDRNKQFVLLLHLIILRLTSNFYNFHETLHLDAVKH